MVVAKQQALSKPIKWFSTRDFWRYEEPQSGRNREFYQTNVDVFGSSEPTADARCSLSPRTPSPISVSMATTSSSASATATCSAAC
ncbi:histidyl-tRNA synthetase [Halarchaeum acidiphilum MH1-52-1]|uniref:Histidine--tRNA ligase n=1 Tax=Halarchaeum acidiphilum MH1-52-1 TaxID=1261545 RepID=U2YH79_9EURY|nr:histidyl-tRNA synthetase [Halarchaeum acidiphilum MH1-52-1]